MKVHTPWVSALGRAAYISSRVSQTTACHFKSRRLACFWKNVHKISEPNRGFIRLQLGKDASVTVRDDGCSFPFLFCCFFQTQSPCSHYYLGDLELNKGQRCSTCWPLITAEMLTSFERHKKGWRKGQECRCGHLQGSVASLLSPRRSTNAARSIITGPKAAETWTAELGRSNKDRFQVSACWNEFWGCAANK